MKIRPVAFLSLLCCLSLPGSISGAQRRPPGRTSVPRIARLLGVWVGYNGQKALERKLGPGRRAIGGHPNSRELWRTRAPAGEIETEGFNLNREGYVIESLAWGLPGAGEGSIPRVEALPRGSGWLGVVYPGMTKRQVERLTARRVAPPRKQGEEWVWRANGFVRPSVAQQQDAYRTWTATLTFRRGRLSTIEVECE